VISIQNEGGHFGGKGERLFEPVVHLSSFYPFARSGGIAFEVFLLSHKEQAKESAIAAVGVDS
jgi:hypothetical protein